MYYYILEQPQSKNLESLQNKIITQIEDKQIMGEAVKSNPVQKPEELAEIGLSKGYNTIVGIGTDSLINKIAPLVSKKGAVLGIVPTEENSSFFELIGCRNWQEACDILPKRKTSCIDLGVLGKSNIFLTYIKLRPRKGTKPTLAKAIFNTYEAEAPILEILVANSVLDLEKRSWKRKGFFDNQISIHFKTDSLDFFEYSLEQFIAADFSVQKIAYDLHHSGYTGNILTEYEVKFREKGYPICRCEAIKN